MDIRTAIKTVTEYTDLRAAEMRQVMFAIMQGQTTPAQMGAFLVGLKMKGETVEEIAAAAGVMRELCTRVDINAEHMVDTCGTGGDGANTFNISTAAALVAAGAGAKVAKHGNRSVSSKCGSADLLEAAGVNLELSPQQMAACIAEVGIGFMFAPALHPAMKHAVGPRRELGIRSFFNILGPLTNPAGVVNQVIGVFDAKWQEPLARVLQKLGSQHVLMVHSDDGLDEISVSAPTRIVELNHDEISSYKISPTDFGIEQRALSMLVVDGIEDSLSKLHSVLNNQAGATRDIVCLNAGAVIYAAGLTENLEQGVNKADEVISAGTAKQKLEGLVRTSQGYKTA